MTAGAILVTFLLAILVGAIVWFVCTFIPPFKPYAPQIGLAAFIVVLLVRFLPLLGQ